MRDQSRGKRDKATSGSPEEEHQLLMEIELFCDHYGRFEGVTQGGANLMPFATVRYTCTRRSIICGRVVQSKSIHLNYWLHCEKRMQGDESDGLCNWRHSSPI